MVGRIKTNIMVNGKDCWTLFDTGARNTYVVEEIAHSQKLLIQHLPETGKASLGGKVHTVKKTCVLVAYVEGKLIYTNANVITEIGKDEEERTIEILFGALAMQQWGIRLILDEERLDLTHYPKEFVEF